MAMDDNRRIPWSSRLRGAWLALAGRAGSSIGPSGSLPLTGRSGAHPQALLMESLIGGLPAPAIVLDRGGLVIAFNHAATTLAPALRRGEPALITLRMPELVDAIRRAGARGEPQRVEFIERVPLDRWFEAFVVPVKLATGDARHADLLLMTFNDLSPLRRVEEMRADFIANASHELRTPLAALLGFIETLQGPAKDDTTAREKFLAIMRGQATRMARLIDDLLSLSRIELNAHLQPSTALDLAPIVRQVADGLQTLARDRDVEIKVTAPSEPLIVLGDRDELIRALENLVENALKYGAAGKRVDAADISGAGATFPYPIYAKWADAYKKETGNGLNYQSIGSGGGIKQIKAKTVTFGASDAPLPGKELDEAGLAQWPMVMGGIVPVVNLDGIKPGELVIDGPRSPRSSSATSPCGTIPRSPSSIRTSSCRRRRSPSCTVRTDRAPPSTSPTISPTSPPTGSRRSAPHRREWPVGIGAKGNEGVANNVGQTKGSIGYVEYAYAKQNKLTYTKMINKAGKTVEPTSEAFQAAAANADWNSVPGFGVILANQPGDQSWPMTAATWILVYKQPSDPAATAEALKFFGRLAPIYGTLVTSFIAMLIAVPVGLGIAIFLTELCPQWLRRPIGIAIELLAGIPRSSTASGACSCSRRSCSNMCSRS
jgi:ABC-type phosphate transport system substrate-binding protein/signal transduction histidine kinase